jgi:hypothetical protein
MPAHRLPQLQAELAELAPLCAKRREEMYKRRAAKKAAIARGEIEDDTVDEWCALLDRYLTVT